MAQYHIDNEYFSRVKREQDAIASTIKEMSAEEDECPYCGRRADTVFTPDKPVGVTIVVKTKCKKCGNEIFLPVSFRMVSFRMACAK